MEEVRSVAMHLDTRLWLWLGVRVAADVGPAVNHQDAEAEVRRASLGDRQSEEAGADNDQVDVHRFTGALAGAGTAGTGAAGAGAPAAGAAGSSRSPAASMSGYLHSSANSQSGGVGNAASASPRTAGFGSRPTSGRYTARRSHQGMSR